MEVDASLPTAQPDQDDVLPVATVAAALPDNPHCAIEAQTTPDSGEVVTSKTTDKATPPNPGKRIRFTEAWDVILLKSVIASKAHVAARGTSQRKFEETLDIFISNSPKDRLAVVTAPTWKTIYERFKKIVADHRANTRESKAASGVAEDETERTQLLDDIVEEMDDTAELRRTERNEKTKKDQELLEAGEAIRAQAVGDGEGTNSKTDDTNVERRNQKHTPSRKRAKRDAFDSEEEESEWVRSHLEARGAAEAKRTCVEEERLAFEKGQSERRLKVEEKEAEVTQRRLELEDRRLALDERRLAIDAEDRRGQMEERKQVLGVLSALIKKLD